MKFSAQEELGLRVMAYVARQRGDEPVTIPEIARAERLTIPYTAKLLGILRRGKLVVGTRGPTGGYHLPRRPGEITVAEVLSVLGGRLFRAELCRRAVGGHPACVHTSECSIRSLWNSLDLIVGEILKRTTLADLSRGEKSIAKWLREQAPAVVEAAARAAAAAGTRAEARS